MAGSEAHLQLRARGVLVRPFGDATRLRHRACRRPATVDDVDAAVRADRVRRGDLAGTLRLEPVREARDLVVGAGVGAQVHASTVRGGAVRLPAGHCQDEHEPGANVIDQQCSLLAHDRAVAQSGFHDRRPRAAAVQWPGLHMIIAWWHWLGLGLILVALEMAARAALHYLLRRRRHRPGGPPAGRRRQPAVGAAGPLCGDGCRLVAAVPSSAPALAEARSSRGERRLDDRRRGGPARRHRAGAVGRASCAGRSGRRATARPARWRGERCRVVTIDQLMILIEPEGAH